MSRKENALELSKLVDKAVRVKLSGGREGKGIGRRRSASDAARHALLSHTRGSPPTPPKPVEGVLKGFDQLLNLVLDEATEYLRGASVFVLLFFVCVRSIPLLASDGHAQPHATYATPSRSVSPSPTHATDKDDPLRITDTTRVLGLCVCRGTAVMAVAPAAGAEELADNPFATAVETGGE